VTAVEAISIDWAQGVADVQTRGGFTPGHRHTVPPWLDFAGQIGAIYRAAGSVHGCALFRDSELWVSVEDVSRRNALDTICGWMALHGVSGKDMILYTT
jgi:formate dehydrogenase assembly factor FdhD